MERDGLMLVAFLAFILLLLWRSRQKNLENDEKGRETGEYSPRKMFGILKLLIFGGAAVYMVVVTVREADAFRSLTDTSFLLRCLIFLFTIYVLVDGIIRMWRH